MEKLFLGAKLLFIPCQENDYKPRFLESEHLFHYVLLLLILKIISISFIFYLPKSMFFADLTKTALIELTNKERSASGVSVLIENPTLNQAAYEKAKDMISQGYFSHWSPTNVSPWYWFKKSGYSYKMAGENLAIGFFDSEEVVRAWLNSPSHKANILNPNFQEIGIAVLKGNFQGSETTVVVQLFGTPLASNAKKNVVSKTTPAPTLQTTPTSSPEITPTPVEENQAPAVAGKEEEKVPAEILGTEFQITNPSLGIKKPSFKFSFLKFMMLDYPKILQQIIFYSLLLVLMVFLLNIFIKIQIQDKRLLCRATSIIALLILFLLTDKQLIIQLIPHNLLI